MAAWNLSLAQAWNDPLYAHVLLNHLPELGLGMALLALLLGFVLRSRKARLAGLALVLLTSSSAWPVVRTGQKGYDRIYYSMEAADRAWLDAHMEAAEKWLWAYMTLAVLALAAILIPLKWPRSEVGLSALVLLTGIGMAGVSVNIAYLGGRVRHVEFRRTEWPEGHSRE